MLSVKKIFYIISTLLIVLILIVFEIVMYFCVGEEALMKKGELRTLWILFPAIILILSFLRDLIIKVKYKDNK